MHQTALDCTEERRAFLSQGGCVISAAFRTAQPR